MIHDFYKLILVTHRQNQSLDNYLSFIKQCVSNGVSCVQLREKNAEPAFKLQFAQGLQELLLAYEVPLIINDDIQLALEVNAAGVHLGQSDASIETARKLLGNSKYIGLSIEAEQELEQANLFALDYVAASAVFPSQHKDNLKKIWGIEGVQKLCKQTKHPVVGIGGLNEENMVQLLQAGAKGAAVIGALHQAVDPAAMSAKLRKIIDNNRTN